MDQNISRTSDRQVTWRRSPLSSPLDDVVYLRGVVTMGRVDGARSQPDQSSVHLHIPSLENSSSHHLSPSHWSTELPVTEFQWSSLTSVCRSHRVMPGAWTGDTVSSNNSNLTYWHRHQPLAAGSSRTESRWRSWPGGGRQGEVLAGAGGVPENTCIPSCPPTRRADGRNSPPLSQACRPWPPWQERSNVYRERFLLPQGWSSGASWRQYFSIRALNLTLLQPVRTFHLLMANSYWLLLTLRSRQTRFAPWSQTPDQPSIPCRHF